MEDINVSVNNYRLKALNDFKAFELNFDLYKNLIDNMKDSETYPFAVSTINITLNKTNIIPCFFMFNLYSKQLYVKTEFGYEEVFQGDFIQVLDIYKHIFKPFRRNTFFDKFIKI